MRLREHLDLSPQSQDLREAILETVAKINSRQEVLRQTLALLDQADVKGTLAIEKEVLTLVEEIEELTATLQTLNLNRTFSRARSLSGTWSGRCRRTSHPFSTGSTALISTFLSVGD